MSKNSIDCKSKEINGFEISYLDLDLNKFFFEFYLVLTFLLDHGIHSQFLNSLHFFVERDFLKEPLDYFFGLLEVFFFFFSIEHGF